MVGKFLPWIFFPAPLTNAWSSPAFRYLQFKYSLLVVIKPGPFDFSLLPVSLGVSGCGLALRSGLELRGICPCLWKHWTWFRCNANRSSYWISVDLLSFFWQLWFLRKFPITSILFKVSTAMSLQRLLLGPVVNGQRVLENSQWREQVLWTSCSQSLAFYDVRKVITIWGLRSFLMEKMRSVNALMIQKFSMPKVFLWLRIRGNAEV